jgi:phytoene dehydrogenase-like protein
MSRDYDVVVIGGGHNGLTAATFLARKGRRVLLVEARPQLGGLAAGEEFYDGFSSVGILHDTQILRSWAVENLGLEQTIEWRQSSLSSFCPQAAGQGPGLLLGKGSTSDEIAQHSATDSQSFEDYSSFLERLEGWIRPLVDQPPPDLFDPKSRDFLKIGRSALSLRRLGRETLMEVLRILPMCTADWLGEWFSSELVRTALAAPALYETGLGPWAPGTNANLVLSSCLGGPGIVGGPAALVQALEKAARSAGVEILTSNAVVRIDFSTGKASGVTLADGTSISSTAIAASCDPKRLFLDLVPAERISLKLRTRMRNYRARGATAKVHLALDGLPDLDCRPGSPYPDSLRVGTTLDFLERASDALKYRRFSAQPALDVRIPTLESPHLAPEGQHVFSILVHCAPFRLEGGWSETRAAELYEATVDSLSAYVPTLRDRIVGSQVLTPADLAERYGLPEGHLLHGEHALDQLVVRPTPEAARYRTPLEGLFLCGSGSHPGGGITCAPGRLGAAAVLTSG